MVSPHWRGALRFATQGWLRRGSPALQRHRRRWSRTASPSRTRGVTPGRSGAARAPIGYQGPLEVSPTAPGCVAHASSRRADEVKRVCPSGSDPSPALLALSPVGFSPTMQPGGRPDGRPHYASPRAPAAAFLVPTQGVGVERRSFRGFTHPNRHPSHTRPRPLSLRTTLLVSPNQLKHRGEFHPAAPTKD